MNLYRVYVSLPALSPCEHPRQKLMVLLDLADYLSHSLGVNPLVNNNCIGFDVGDDVLVAHLRRICDRMTKDMKLLIEP